MTATRALLNEYRKVFQHFDINHTAGMDDGMVDMCSILSSHPNVILFLQSTVKRRKNIHARKFRKMGYHFYIRHDGTMTQHRMLLEVRAHVVPYNHCSIGICYEGGLGENGLPCDTRTSAQTERMTDLLTILHKMFPSAKMSVIKICRVRLPSPVPASTRTRCSVI